MNIEGRNDWEKNSIITWKGHLLGMREDQLRSPPRSFGSRCIMLILIAVSL